MASEPRQEDQPRNRISQDQFDALVDFMEGNPNLARGRLLGPDARQRTNVLWRQLTEKLNSMGGAMKTTKAWIKYWTDKKHNLKGAATKIRQAGARTGGGTEPVPKLTELNLRLLNILGDGFGERDNIPRPEVAQQEDATAAPARVVSPEPFEMPPDQDEPDDMPVIVVVQEDVDETIQVSPPTEPHELPQRQTRRESVIRERQRLRNQLTREKERLIRMEERRIMAEEQRSRNQIEIVDALRGLAQDMRRVADKVDEMNTSVKKIADALVALKK